VYEDHQWANVNACRRDPRHALGNDYFIVSCVVVPSARLYFSLVYKAGTRSLLRHLRCLFPDATEYSGHRERRLLRCSRVPANYTHVAVVREPFERLISGYLQLITLGRWMERSRAAFEQTFYDALRVGSCRHDGDWAHMASQALLVRQRRVDRLVLLPDLASALSEPRFDPHGRAASCNLTKAVNRLDERLDNPKLIAGDLVRSHPVEGYFQKLRRSHPLLLLRACQWYLQDYECIYRQAQAERGGAAEQSLDTSSLYGRYCFDDGDVAGARTSHP
jgi:hypothetical protein